MKFRIVYDYGRERYYIMQRHWFIVHYWMVRDDYLVSYEDLTQATDDLDKIVLDERRRRMKDKVITEVEI